MYIYIHTYGGGTQIVFSGTYTMHGKVEITATNVVQCTYFSISEWHTTVTMNLST